MFRYLMAAVILAFATSSIAEDSPPPKKADDVKPPQTAVPEGPGLLIPMYIYPKSGQPDYARLLELKNKYKTVPMCVIVNAASGPGKSANPDYLNAINQLTDAGCIVIGYVATGYTKKSLGQVTKEADQWLEMYPRIQGMFFDEMRSADSSAGAEYYAALSRHARDKGCRLTVCNAGAFVPSRYFAARAADIFVVHEHGNWPQEGQLKRYSSPAYTRYPANTRGVLVYSQSGLDKTSLQMVRKYAGWVYVTSDVLPNPWDTLPDYLEEECMALSEKS